MTWLRLLGLLGLLALLACGDTYKVYEGVTVIPGSLTINSQAELELIAGVKQILGDLDLGSGAGGAVPISDLSPLSELYYVSGRLNLHGLPHITSLRPLRSLQVVGTELHIDDMSNLRSLDGLESLWGIGSKIEIAYNANLQSIEGLAGLRQMEWSYIFIHDNPELLSLRGLEGLESLADGTATYAQLTIRRCPRLENLAGLENVKELNELFIQDCAALESLSALSSLEHLDLRLSLADLPLLASLDGLTGLAYCPRIEFADLPALTSLAPLAPSGLYSVDLRGTGLRDLSSLPPLVPPAQLDVSHAPSFQCLDGLPGPLDFVELSLFQLDSLSSLTAFAASTVTHALTIRACPRLTGLEGLEAVSLLKSSLEIADNAGLLDLAGLAGLDSVTWGVTIRGNAALCDTLVDAFLAGLRAGGPIVAEDNALCGPPPRAGSAESAASASAAQSP
jgi:hypothetical protein